MTGLLSIDCFPILPSAWAWVTVSHSAGPCLPFIRPSCSPVQNPHPKNHSQVLSDQPSQVPHGICQTLLLLPMLGNVCLPGISASHGHQYHSHLCALLLWQRVSTIAGHFWCFHLIPPCPPSLADITCPPQQWTTWPCGFCHLFPRAAGKECSEFKPVKWSVITWGTMNPTSSLHIILWQRGLKGPSCFLLRFTEVCLFLTQSPVFA